jgi:hypothetical protein
MGDNPRGTDATAFGALAGVLTPFFVARLRDQAEQFANLTAYVDRMMLQYYRLDAAAAGRVNGDCLQCAAGGSPFSAASSDSSSAMRASRAANAAATSAASNFSGICCGQLVSHAAIMNRMTCSGRAL